MEDTAALELEVPNGNSEEMEARALAQSDNPR